VIDRACRWFLAQPENYLGRSFFDALRRAHMV
jgi:hypothetical protein